MLEPIFFFRLMRVAPQQVKHFLMVFRVVAAKFDFDWPLNLLNSFNILNCRSNSAMATEYSLLFIGNDCGEGHLIKSFINLCKHTVWIIDVFSQSFGAFIAKTKVFIDIFVFVVASEQNNLLWIFQLQGKKKTNDFEAVLALVDVVSKEKVVKSVNISSVLWRLPNIKETHQINVLTMNIAKDFDWGSDFFDDDWLSSHDLGAFIRQLNNMLPFARKFCAWFDFLAFFCF